jgi:uncharacterized protein (DUF2267 family)
MSQHYEESTMSWSGLGVGTDRESFLEKVHERVPELDAAEAAEGVFCVLSERISGGTVQRLFDQLPPDVRDLFNRCNRRKQAKAKPGNRDDFYLSVAEHLMVDPEQVRRILFGVFGALHSQITEAESDRVASELPDSIASTWLSSRHGVPAPH